jgi:hypothetical protein
MHKYGTILASYREQEEGIKEVWREARIATTAKAAYRSRATNRLPAQNCFQYLAQKNGTDAIE